jgi:hypothetical protein
MTESNDNIEAYYVAINDLFKVPSDEVDSKEEAEQYALKRFGEAGWIPYDAEVVDVEE